MKSTFLPFGFTYPQGKAFQYSKHNPHPGLTIISERMDFLNEVIGLCPIPDYKAAAALHLLQVKSGKGVDQFWNPVVANLTHQEVAEMACALANEPEALKAVPPLDWPNTIALVDCRFVANSEWVLLRRFSMGGSDASAILGVGRFNSPASICLEKRPTYTGEKTTIAQSYIYKYGHEIEVHVLQRMADEVGAVLYPEFRMFCHKDHPMVTCNADGILVFVKEMAEKANKKLHAEYEKLVKNIPDGYTKQEALMEFLLWNFPPSDFLIGLGEAKTATRHKKESWEDGIPEYYQPQPIQYREVLNDHRVVRGYIACCFGSGKYDWVMHECKWDDARGKDQIAKEVDFWNNYIAAGVLPPLSGNAELDMAVIYGYGNAPSVNPYGGTSGSLPAECEALLEELRIVREKRKALTSDYNKAKQKRTDLQNVIIGQIPEGFVVVKNPEKFDVSYRISLTVTESLKVKEQDLYNADPLATVALKNFEAALAEPGLDFSTPKIVFATTKTTKTKKKGA